LRSVDAISFCESIETLESVFIHTWNNKKNIDAEKLDFQRRYFYFDDSRTYGERLLDLSRDIINGIRIGVQDPSPKPE
jgi:hypothetical protein